MDRGRGSQDRGRCSQDRGRDIPMDRDRQWIRFHGLIIRKCLVSTSFHMTALLNQLRRQICLQEDPTFKLGRTKYSYVCI
jgi:hypothetical protein